MGIKILSILYILLVVSPRPYGVSLMLAGTDRRPILI